MRQWQHTVPSGLVAGVSAWVCWLSYTQEPAQAFLFPRLISTVMLALALWTFGKALLGLSRAGDGIGRTMFLNILPGLVVLVVYVFWAAQALGFYTSGTIAFFLLLSIYDPAPNDSPRTWLRRVLVTAGFLAVMYGLFAVVLKVFTPPEILFR